MDHFFKKINTQGITYIEPLVGCNEWYWGMDYTHGDLYEAEELFRDGRPVSQNKLLFVHDPDGTVVQPVVAQESAQMSFASAAIDIAESMKLRGMAGFGQVGEFVADYIVAQLVGEKDTHVG